MEIIVLVSYLALQMVIAYWVSKKIRNETDFFLAGRTLPTWLLSFSLFATWFGAETCIGTAGAVYTFGLSGSRADPFGYSICLFLLGLFIARKLWLGQYTTLADFFRQRFSSHVEKLAVIILVPSSLIWGAAQMRAFGQIVSQLTGWDLELTIWLCFIFVTSYTLLGGLLGDIITDLIQGLIIAFSLIALLITLLLLDIDWLSWFQSLPPERLSFISPSESLLERLDRWSVPIFGSLIAQELISRILAAKSPGVAQRSAYISGAIYLFFGSIPVLLGLMGPALIQQMTDPEHFLTTIAANHLSPLFYLIFSGALVSAILATIDSILLSSSALISRNLVAPYLKFESEKSKVLIARFFVFASALFTVLVVMGSGSIYQLIEIASSFGTAGVLIITIFGLHSRIGGPRSAFLTLIMGLLAYPLLNFYMNHSAPFLMTLFLSFLTYTICSFLEPKTR